MAAAQGRSDESRHSINKSMRLFPEVGRFRSHHNLGHLATEFGRGPCQSKLG